ncbi:MAG: ATP-dependent helicase [Pseudomonadota bacterium]
MANLTNTVLTYATDGSSKKTDNLGMRAMQARVWLKRDAPYLLVKSPPASGKSRAAMFVALDKLNNQGMRKVVVAVPERSIGASFHNTDLVAHGFFEDWRVDCDLCGVGSETGSKVKELINFLQASEGRVALCTHATLRFAYGEAGLEPFDNCLVCIDELHHASTGEDSRLGALIRGLMEKGTSHILAMTGSYFRGDRQSILNPEDEMRFERVIYTYYEQLNGYEHLKTLGISFHFYRGRYLDSIPDVLDPSLKTIVHIPHVRSSEAVADKMFEVDAIISALGQPIGQDPDTGFEMVKAGRRTLKIANLVDDGPGREKVMASLRAVKKRDDVDLIVALGMAKEGFDWIWCEHVLTVGYRGSLTEVVQIIGRATRDAPGKRHAQFTNLVSMPFAGDETVARAVNDMLKAISVSLLMEQVMAPVFRFRTHRDSDEMTGDQPAAPPPPVTNTGEIEVIGMPPFDPDVAAAVQTDFTDLFADVQNDPRTLTVMINPDEHHTDVIHDMVVADVVRRRYPEFTDEQVQDAATLFHARTNLARGFHEDGQAAYTAGRSEAVGQNGPSANGEHAAVPEGGQGDGPRGPTGGDNFVRATRRFIDIRDLQVDLLGSRRDFDDAYELLSKSLSEDVLRQLHGEVRSMRVTMTEEEAKRLYPRIKEFVHRESREPNLNADNGREVRLADALALLRRLKRQRDQDLTGADNGGENE